MKEPAGAAGAVSSGALQNMFYALDGNEKPIGTVVQLIASFVDRSFQEEGLKQDFQFLPFFRHEGRASCRIQVRAKKNPAHGMEEQLRPWLQQGNIFRSNRSVLEKGAIGGIMKGADHAGHIP